MIIRDSLLSPFFIKSYSDGWQLIQKSTIQSGEKKGQEAESTIGYFTSVASAIKKAIMTKLRDREVKISLEEYLKELEEVRKTFNLTMEKYTL